MHIVCLMMLANRFNYLSIPRSSAAFTSQFRNPTTFSFKVSSGRYFKLFKIFSWTELNSENFIVKSSNSTLSVFVLMLSSTQARTFYLNSSYFVLNSIPASLLKDVSIFNEELRRKMFFTNFKMLREVCFAFAVV